LYVEPQNRKCKNCEAVKPLDAFEPHRRVCRVCKDIKARIKRSSTPEGFLASLYTHAKYTYTNRKHNRSHPNKTDFAITKQDLIDLWYKQNGRCAISGVVMTHHKDGGGRKDFNASIDRIIPHEAYTPENIQLVAGRINFIKHELSEDLLHWWVRTIYEHQKFGEKPSDNGEDSI